MPGEAPVTKQMNGASLQRQDPNVKTAGNVRKHALDPDFGSRIQGRQRAKSGIPKVVLAPDYGIREKRFTSTFAKQDWSNPVPLVGVTCLPRQVLRPMTEPVPLTTRSLLFRCSQCIP